MPLAEAEIRPAKTALPAEDRRDAFSTRSTRAIGRGFAQIDAGPRRRPRAHAQDPRRGAQVAPRPSCSRPARARAAPQNLCAGRRRDHPRRPPVRDARGLSGRQSLGRRGHRARRRRRLWPRHAGAGLRHRSALHPALQADALGRAGHRIHPLYALGPRPEGRPRRALGRRLPPHGARPT